MGYDDLLKVVILLPARINQYDFDTTRPMTDASL